MNESPGVPGIQTLVGRPVRPVENWDGLPGIGFDLDRADLSIGHTLERR